LDNEKHSKELHIGDLVKAELKRQERSIAWLAKQIGYTRQNLYHLLSRPYIYTDLLLKISDILDHDFFGCLSSEWQNKRKETNESLNDK
jgi:lambda repressor-like predicted transcriptional regulator